MPKKAEGDGVLCHCGDLFSDYQKVHMRKSVCKSLPVTYKHADNFYCVFHFPSEEKEEEFAKRLEEKIKRSDYFFSGTWFPRAIDLSTHAFKVWADFAWTTFTHEVTFANARFLGNCHFVCATFKSKVSFASAVFSPDRMQGLPTNFNFVTFENIADFSSAKFKSKTDFNAAKFLVGYSASTEPSLVPSPASSFAFSTFEEESEFENATFGNPSPSEAIGSITFSGATFEKTTIFQGAKFLLHAHFGQVGFKKTADFRNTLVKGSLSFEGASFEGFAKFSGQDKKHSAWHKNGLNFSSVDIERSEKISFQTLELKPDSFINTDVRRFDFTDIKWKTKSFGFDWARSKDILYWKESAKQRKTGYQLLEVVYRRLAVNAEDSNHYTDASKFRYTAFDIQRINRWYGRLPITLLWWYKWTSQYGEIWWWTALVLGIVLSLSAYAYTQVNFIVCPIDKPISQSSSASLCVTRPLAWSEAGRHSLATATFQGVEYRKPATGSGETFVLLEKILAPIQAALLALAIRRKVMR